MTFSELRPNSLRYPVDTPSHQLRVRHGGYDIRAAQCDPNVVLPIDRLRELEREGIFGDLAPNAYSFVGATSQLRLQKEAAPEWVALFQAQQIDALILVPV
jgi:D-proline reductase (dithiol) PrdB